MIAYAMYINGWKQIFGDGWIKRCPPPRPFQGFKTDETGGREGFRLSSSRFEKSNGKSVLSGETIRQSTFLIVFDNEQCPCVHTMETRDVYVCVCVCVCVYKTGNSDPFLWTNEWNFYRRGLSRACPWNQSLDCVYLPLLLLLFKTGQRS